jgi:hypothetical protein
MEEDPDPEEVEVEPGWGRMQPTMKWVIESRMRNSSVEREGCRS